MKRSPRRASRRALSCLALLALAPAVTAETALPPGHPPVPAGSASAPEARGGLPEGHPPVGAGRPAAQVPGEPRRDESRPDPDLPVGTVVVELRDGEGAPRAGKEVALGILRQSVSEGDRSERRVATTDSSGLARFDGLQGGATVSFRATAREGAAEFASAPFLLPQTGGQRVILHVYPATTDVNQTLLGMRGVVYVEPRDDVFQLEVMLSVFNVGQRAWTPQGVELRMPEGFKAFNAPDPPTDARVVSREGRLWLTGTYPPGQRDVSFRFQVPNPHEPRARFVLGLPPHVAELQVLAEAGQGMTLDARGRSAAGELPFGTAQESRNQRGQRLLVAQRRLRPGEPELTELSFELTGLPTRGQGQWAATALAVVLALLGLGGALSRKGAERSDRDSLERARDVLLDQLATLEGAAARGEVGPRAHQRLRAELLGAVARLELRLEHTPQAVENLGTTRLSARD